MATQVPMTVFLEGFLRQGVTWEKLQKASELEAKRRGIKFGSRLADLKAFAKWKATHGWEVEITEAGVRGNPLPKPEKPKPAAKPKAAKAKPAAKAAKPKNGKPTGRKTHAVKENGRQAVESVHPTNAEMKRDERDVPPTGQDEQAV